MAAALAWSAAAAWLYGPVLLKLVRAWATDASYSHGFFVLPIALWLVWRRRDALRAAPAEPDGAGLAVVLFAMLMYVGGTLAAELFVTRVSLLVLIAGTILYAAGRERLRLVAFPLAFLLLMIPLPAIVFDRIAVGLQLISSSLGERLLQAADVPVLRDGNVLTLANATLEVSDACSGIRSIMALLAIALVLGHLAHPSRVRQTCIALAAIPVAVLLNAVRIALTGAAVIEFGPAAAVGFVHEASGWVVFVAALGCLWVVSAALERASRWSAPLRWEVV